MMTGIAARLAMLPHLTLVRHRQETKADSCLEWIFFGLVTLRVVSMLF